MTLLVRAVGFKNVELVREALQSRGVYYSMAHANPDYPHSDDMSFFVSQADYDKHFTELRAELGDGYGD
jgi:hypothetical protein